MWLEFVKLRTLKKYEEITPDKKAKIDDDIEYNGRSAIIRKSFIENNQKALCSLNEKLALSVNKQKLFTDKEFFEILDRCAETRHKLDTELWPIMEGYKRLFCNITGEKQEVFKTLLDLYHYRNGGNANGNAAAPAKAFIIVSKFRYAHDVCEKYGFKVVKNKERHFNIETTFGELKKNAHKWERD
jgi:hypothetical protein